MKNLLLLACLLTLPALAVEPVPPSTGSPLILMPTSECSHTVGMFTTTNQNCIDHTTAAQIIRLKYDRECVKRQKYTTYSIFGIGGGGYVEEEPVNSKQCALYVDQLSDHLINSLGVEFNQAEYEAYVGGYKAAELNHGRRSDPTPNKEIYKKWVMYKFIKNLDLK